MLTYQEVMSIVCFTAGKSSKLQGLAFCTLDPAYPQPWTWRSSFEQKPLGCVLTDPNSSENVTLLSLLRKPTPPEDSLVAFWAPPTYILWLDGLILELLESVGGLNSQTDHSSREYYPLMSLHVHRSNSPQVYTTTGARLMRPTSRVPTAFDSKTFC